MEVISDREVGELWKRCVDLLGDGYTKASFDGWPTVRLIRKLVEERAAQHAEFITSEEMADKSYEEIMELCKGREQGALNKALDDFGIPAETWKE